MTLAEELAELSIATAWSMWSSLGVSSWTRGSDVVIEVEPLIVFTSIIGPRDPRLLREAVDWCSTYDEFVSLHQLRHVVSTYRWPFRGEIDDFGATMSRQSRRRWPGKESGHPHEVTLSGKSRLPDLDAPSLLQLRLRACFGVSARAEILRLFVTHTSPVLNASQIAARVAYSRRQISHDLEMLTLGGLLTLDRPTAVQSYRLVASDEFFRLVGPVPDVAPPWAPLFRVMTAVVEASNEVSGLSAPRTELSRRMRLLHDVIDQAGVAPPPRGPDVSDVSAWSAWALDLFRWVADLASAR